MPSRNRQLLSSFSTSRSSRPTQTDRPIPASRLLNVPSRPFIIILTNNRDMLQQTSSFRRQIEQPIQTTVPVRHDSNSTGTVDTTTTTTNNNNRERILRHLLRAELGEVTRDYLSRSRRSSPVHYIFEMSYIESQQP